MYRILMRKCSTYRFVDITDEREAAAAMNKFAVLITAGPRKRRDRRKEESFEVSRCCVALVSVAQKSFKIGSFSGKAVVGID